MASMRDIKRRKESVQSTGQITKAMKLVSSVKLQKAKVGAELSKPYFDTMYETVADMIARSGQLSHPFLKKSESDKKAVIVITSNRGLAGGYNSNVVKLVTHDERFKKENTEDAQDESSVYISDRSEILRCERQGKSASYLYG